MSVHRLGNWVSTPSSSLQKQPFLIIRPFFPTRPSSCFSSQALSSSKLRITLKRTTLCNVKRRVRHEEDDKEEEEEYGVNQEILMLESYSESAREEALLVKAEVDGQEVEVLIFKGFSSSLSYGTSPDPSKTVLPARAVIKSIDRVKGPFDPSDIEYLQKGLTWKAFQNIFFPNS